MEPAHVRPPCRTLGEYVVGLVERLEDGEPHLADRLRTVVGARRARIRLDDEAVDMWFEGSRLRTAPADGAPVDGEGGTDRQTTADLLSGRLEVTDAILQGRLRARGPVESLVRIFQAIEILLDAAMRVPSLRHLSRDYLTDPCRPGPRGGRGDSGAPLDRALPPVERDILERHGLLP